MLYKKVLEEYYKLKENLIFQERRNFFNKIKDKHLNIIMSIIDSVLEKIKEYELSYKDLADVIDITVKMISYLKIDDDINKQVEINIKELKELSIASEKKFIEMKEKESIY